MIKKLLKWLGQSNRWKHLVGGFGIGICACDWFSAMYAGGLTASALEYKDKAHGGSWDWIDFGLTMVGTFVGQLLRIIV